MKRKDTTMSCALAWLLITLCFRPVEYSSTLAQEIRAARKIDEYQVRLLRSHDEQMRLWSAFDDIKKEREDTRLFVISYGPYPGSARRHANRVRNYWVDAHGLNPNRIVTVDGGYRAERSVEIWIVPSGAGDPVPRPDGSLDRSTDVAWKYDEFSLDGWWFSTDYEKEAERLDGFAAALKSNPTSKGSIVVHRGTIDCETCLRPGTEMKFAEKEKEYLVKKHRIAPSRIAIIRAGRVGGGRIQLWVIPNGTSLPTGKYSLRSRR
jgi:hypothetical protein